MGTRGRICASVLGDSLVAIAALADSQNWERSGNNAWRVATLAYLYGKTNQRAKALECLSELQKQYPNHAALAIMSSFPYLGLNDKENALQCLERSLANHSISTAIAVEPFYDSLREEPRFQAILAKMNFPANAGSSQLRVKK